jgi:hypothetical protein
MRTIFITSLLFVSSTFAAETIPPAPTHLPTQWKLSIAALIAANVADVVSSRNKYEGNAVLQSSNGTFSTGKAIGVKAAMAGLPILGEYFVLRHHPRLGKLFTFVNYGEAGVFGAAAVHNFTIPTIKHR